jgi:RNA polymerase sigma factor (TIGR02999 family)
MGKERSQDVTEMLELSRLGDQAAGDRLLSMVYDELRALAGFYFKRQHSDHTLEPTALVHEAFIKLAGSETPDWKDRAHFMAVAAKAMRQVLADHARGKKTVKRGGGQERVTLSGLETPLHDESPIDLLDLDEALDKLSEISPRQSSVVEMRFFAGLGEDEVAHVLGVTPRTVQREWRVAKAFLRSELSGESLL